MCHSLCQELGQICGKIKYEISTDLPSARAHRFESDERDLSPALTYHCSALLGEVDEDELSTLRHTFFDRLLLDRVVLGSSGGVRANPRAHALRYPARLGSAAHPCA